MSLKKLNKNIIRQHQAKLIKNTKTKQGAKNFSFMIKNLKNILHSFYNFFYNYLLFYKNIENLVRPKQYEHFASGIQSPICTLKCQMMTKLQNIVH